MTLKANELRIGNYLNGKQGHVIITQIKENNIVKIHDNTSSFYVGDCLLPIPLTREWLFKFGFEKDGEDLILDTNLFLLVSYNDDEFVHLKSNHLETIISVKYVHQLQNLYFALTGEELTLKNNSNN